MVEFVAIQMQLKKSVRKMKTKEVYGSTVYNLTKRMSWEILLLTRLNTVFVNIESNGVVNFW